MSAFIAPSSRADDEDDGAAPRSDAAGVTEASQHRTWLAVLVWAVLGIAVLVATIQIATFDLRSRPLVGDEASHVLQTLSLAYDGNLSYDMGDLDRFEAMEWPGARRPNGVFFQHNEDGWAFSKPYGWSLSAAPLVRLFGPFPGFGLTSASLFLVVVAAAFGIGRRAGRYGAAFGVASVVGSVTWLYGFTAHTEMFLAAVISATTFCIVQYRETSRVAWLITASILSGFAISEKPLFVVGLAPILIVLTWKRGWRHVVIGGATAAAGFLLAIVPYLYYSDGASWNPYAVDRYYRSDGALPFTPEAPPFTAYRLMTEAAENFSPSVILDRATRDPGERAEAFGLSIVGRHTGMLVFLPFTLVMLAIALSRRRAPGRGDAIAVAVGITAYLAVYALLYPNNYFGGEQSLGNRYLVQLAPLALAGLAFARPKPRTTIMAGCGAAILAIAFLLPHFNNPSEAFVRIDRTSPLQRRLPEERKVMGIRLFRCGIPAVMWGPFELVEDRRERIKTQETCLGVPSTLPPEFR